jgi:hypothetical protein
MEPEDQQILEHLVGAGLLTKEEQAIVQAAAQSAARIQTVQANKVVCNRNYCVVVRPL